MVQAKVIQKSIPHVLKTIDIPQLGKKSQGKVRDIYFKDKERILITTDRQSAFDVILGHIPFKGAVLNLLAAFWFKKTEHIVANHMVSVPDPNVLIAKNCQSIPIEMVIRGYISGVTNTSIWGSYQKGERVIYGLKFPEGLKKNQRLETPVITPTTHGGGAGGHDERLTREQIIERKIVPKKLYEQMEEATYDLFKYGSKLCERHGLILVDTKYEFGKSDGRIHLIDEIHTPDSSRYFYSEGYEERQERNEQQRQLSKEFVRKWLIDNGFQGKEDQSIPEMSPEFVQSISERYIELYEHITGDKFIKNDHSNALKRVENNIIDALKRLG